MVHRWHTGGTQEVHRWHTGGTQVVHRWYTGGTQEVHGWYTGGTDGGPVEEVRRAVAGVARRTRTRTHAHANTRARTHARAHTHAHARTHTGPQRRRTARCLLGRPTRGARGGWTGAADRCWHVRARTRAPAHGRHPYRRCGRDCLQTVSRALLPSPSKHTRALPVHCYPARRAGADGPSLAVITRAACRG